MFYATRHDIGWRLRVSIERQVALRSAPGWHEPECELSFSCQPASTAVVTAGGVVGVCGEDLVI